MTKYYVVILPIFVISLLLSYSSILYSQQNVVDGRVTYYDIDESQMLPLKNVHIRIETIEPQHTFHTYTNDNGEFSQELPWIPEEVTARLFFENDKIQIQDVSTVRTDRRHKFWSGLGYGGCIPPELPCEYELPNPYTNMDIEMLPNSLNSKIAKVFVLVNKAADFCILNGYTPPQCIIKYPAEKSISTVFTIDLESFYWPFGSMSYGNNFLPIFNLFGTAQLTEHAIYIEESDVFINNRTTIFHEYGHFVLHAKRDWDWPISLSEYAIGDATFNHSWQEASQQPRTAFIEGWADFFAAAVESWVTLPENPYTGLYHWGDYDIYLTNPQDANIFFWDGPNYIRLLSNVTNGYEHELLIGAAFFDFYDPDADDDLQTSFLNILNVIGDRDNDMKDYISRFAHKDFLNDPQRSAGIHIMEINKMDPLISYGNANLKVKNNFAGGKVYINNVEKTINPEIGELPNEDIWMTGINLKAVQQIPADGYYRLFTHTDPVNPRPTWRTDFPSKYNFSEIWDTHIDNLTATAYFDKWCDIYVNYQNLDGGTLPGGLHDHYRSDRILTLGVPSIEDNNRTYYFVKWSDGSTEIPRPHVVQEDLNLTAYYKAPLITSSTEATKGCNQRKIEHFGSDEYSVYVSGGHILYSYFHNGIWSPEQVVSSIANPNAKNPSIAVDQYYVHIVWEEKVDNINYVYYRRFNHNASVQSAIVQLSYVDGSFDGTPVVSTYGSETQRAVVVWKKFDGNPEIYGMNLQVQLDPLGTNPIYGLDLPQASLPSIIQDQNNYALVYINSENRVEFCRFSLNSETGAPSIVTNPSVISEALTGCSNPSIARDNYYGNIFVAWDALNGSTRHIFVRERNVAGTWQTRTEFSHGSHQMQYPSVGVNDAGGLVNVVYVCGDHLARKSRPRDNTTWNGQCYLGQGYFPAIPSYGTPQFFRTIGITQPYSIASSNIATVPSVVSLSQPSNATENVDLGLSVVWNATFNAASYNVQLATDESFYNIVFSSTGIVGTTCQVNDLEYDTKYYWHVQAVNEVGMGNWSTPWWFKTKIPPPQPPQLVSPQNGAQNIPTVTTLTWNSSPGATSYRLQVSPDNNFGWTWRDQSGITSTSYQISGLNYTDTYYWHVKAKNSSDSSAWSSVRSFTTCSAPPSGCPYISSWNGDHYILDNNVLQLSEYEENKGKLVTDFYKLNASPELVDGSYILELSEFEQERSTIDEVKLLAVDHDKNTDIAMMDDGKIVEYISAFKMKEGGCQCLGYEEKLSSFDGKAHYTSPGEKFIMSFEPVLADYATLENIKLGALLGGWVENNTKRLWAPAPPPKVESVGDLGEDEIAILKPAFTFRQRGTLVYIPLVESAPNIFISFTKRVGFDYASLVAVVPNPTYSIQELPLKNAIHTNMQNVINQLEMKDGITEELYPGEMIKLIYSAVPLESGKVRSFVLVTTGLYEHVGSEVRRIPVQFKLDESYPNPFNPQTTIRYELAQSGHVSVIIYNQLGQEITKLVDQEQESGYYERHWDATNVTSGTYFVQMIIENQFGKHLYQETKKLLLMK